MITRGGIYKGWLLNFHPTLKWFANRGNRELRADTRAKIKQKVDKARKKGRRCCITTSKNMRYTGVCRNLATHRVYNAGCESFLVCDTHRKGFMAYRMKPVDKEGRAC